jgi:6,7-dimethyl-8-ribityllumazine synthase
MANDYRLVEADSAIHPCHVAIVMSKYNSYIVDSLLQGCVATLNSAGIGTNAITVVKVPGAVEIPVTARQLAATVKPDAIITLGAIIRGETPHFDIIAQTCSDGVTRVALDYGLPVIFGVLTVDNVAQAQDRAGDAESNKGSEAAQAAVEMISVMRKIGA